MGLLKAIPHTPIVRYCLNASLPVQYSDRLWLNLIDRVTVYEDESLVFRFKNGAEITEML